MNIPFKAYDFRTGECGAVLEGFSGQEPIGRWSDRSEARITLEQDDPWPSELQIEIHAFPFVAPDRQSQRISISVNDIPKGDWEFHNHFQKNEIILSLELGKIDTEQPIDIRLKIEHPAQPSCYDMGDDDRYLGLLVESIALSKPAAERPDNPYRKLPPHHFWYRSISSIEPHLVDPVTSTRFKIAADARVGTAGSCFAQHISRRIMASGFNYFVTEPGTHLPERERARNNYGTFSARYGNIYTTVQLLQLFEESFGERIPEERIWQRPDGRFIDPFRQQIQPEGFETEEAVLTDRQKHLSAVRKLFQETDIFVFTLGLTEAWRACSDRTVLSAAPGVVGGVYDPARYEFVNFTLEETYGALSTFLDRFHAINPTAKVLLTVSPVPLIATFEDRSVLVSTTYSKSVLRVAAETALRQYEWVDYFPSYEIITGSFSGGLYYHDDYREVNSLGVAHAMRCFMKNYIQNLYHNENKSSSNIILKANVSEIICDEEVIEGARG